MLASVHQGSPRPARLGAVLTRRIQGALLKGRHGDVQCPELAGLLISSEGPGTQSHESFSSIGRLHAARCFHD